MNAAPAAPTWNVLVTAQEGERETLRIWLRPLGRFRRAGYPNVLVATVDDPLAFVARLAEARAASPELTMALAKAIPIDRSVCFAGPAAFVDTMIEAITPVLDRLHDRTFFVRVLRRGFRGQIDSTTAEREIGARLYGLLQERGQTPRVRFTDADVAVVIETIRDEAGIAFLPRALRDAYPFVRVR